jgi:hypothetical protein
MLNLEFEMIVIEDKSTDDTLERVREFVKDRPHVHLIAHEKNRGRGYTVSEGIKKARGAIAGFIDVDLEVDCHNIIPFILKVLDGYDVVNGHRIYKIRWWDPRWILSRGYVVVTKFFCHTPFDDTEAGFKFFNREKILPVIQEVEDHHWFWDTEVMVRAYYHGLSITDIPILFIRKNQAFSTLHTFSDTFYYFKKLLGFRKVVKAYEEKKRAARSA